MLDEIEKSYWRQPPPPPNHHDGNPHLHHHEPIKKSNPKSASTLHLI